MMYVDSFVYIQKQCNGKHKFHSITSGRRMQSKVEDYLKKIWYNPRHPASFSGPSKLFQVVKEEGKYNIGLFRIKQFLQNQDAYSLQKKVRRKGFKRRRVVVQGVDFQWEADLMDVQSLASYNNAIRFLLVVVDVFSRYLWVEPLKDKKAKSVINAFDKIFKGTRHPRAIRSDKGSEFYNRYFKQYLKEKGIKIFYALNETKANYAERYIQTLRKRLIRYQTHVQKYKYVDILQDVVNSINETPNRSLDGRKPASINKDNEEEVRFDAYLARTRKQSTTSKPKTSSRRKPAPYTLKIGDQVRITHLKRTFQRDFDQTYTEEIFVVRSRFRSQGIPIYQLKDMMDENINGSFYASELQKITAKDDKTIWRIDKILRKRKVKGRTEVLVQWRGWPKKFNSYVAEKDIKET